MDVDGCFFKWKFNCEDKHEKLIESGPGRIETIIKCSKLYLDGKHQQLQEDLQKNRCLTVRCHKNCVCTYTSTTQIQRHLKRQGADNVANPSKKTRRSSDALFTFQLHCLFCGDLCQLEKDSKNPARWRPAYLCREIEDKGEHRSPKQSILEVCDIRDDEWANTVRVRVQGAISDLHAADARYHVDCKSKFMSPKSVTTAIKPIPIPGKVDDALQLLIKNVQEDLTRIWNSVELFDTYIEHGGSKLSRKLVVKHLADYFGDDLLVLSSAGLANIIAFRSKASNVLRLVDEPEDDLDIAINKVSKKITNEVKAIPRVRYQYRTRINSEDALDSVSQTVKELLARLSPKLDKTLPAILIGSIITSVLQNQPTSLQVDLGILIRTSKKLVALMHGFGVTCSYDEVLRFKKSAALATTANVELSGISNVNSGLVQVVVDNFDADISSQNGKLSTHSLAVLITQSDTDGASKEMKMITRIHKNDMTEPMPCPLHIQRFNGPNNPQMPQNISLKVVLPLKVLTHAVIARQRADEEDIAFLQDVLITQRCPEFNGYNTANSRQQGTATQPQTNTVYQPLIDMTPSDPDTMMTALTQAQQRTLKTGQDFVVFTCDLQLYRVAQHVIWTYPDRFSNIILRLGGMHSLMSFVGSVGTLMAESGLADVLSAVFGGVPKMLTGKKFPQNVRALRMVMEEVLRNIIGSTHITRKQDLMDVLDDLSSKSNTTKLWVDVLIKPVFIMMMFIRAEREGDWPLHLQAFRQMIPYYFAAGHVHYARYGLLYLRTMEALPVNVLEHFMKGEHVMRHIPGIWNGIWSDMYIETTFMRYGHGQGGIIGITLKPETLKIWALSLHICGQLESDLADMVEGESENVQATHKEERPTRLTKDAHDREGIRRKLVMCIDPLDPEKHPEGIVNIVTGRVGPSSVNVHDAIAIGRKQMSEYENTWPAGFHSTIHKTITTMAITKKNLRVGEARVFDTNLIYARVIGLQASARAIDFHSVLTHELAPIPTSMFMDDGEMRIAKGKSILKKLLQVEVSSRTAAQTEVTVIDGSALLWVVHWPTGGTVKTFVKNFRGHIERKLQTGDVYLVFDRYHEYSTKSAARAARTTGASRVHLLNADTNLPSQKIILTVTDNKKQLIDLIFTMLIEDKLFHHNHIHKHKLIITGQNKTPVEISNGGIVIHRRDMDTTHEEADNIMVQQMLMVAKEDPTGITVLSDDTDVFILLLHYYLEEHLNLLVTMESPITERIVVDIGKTVSKHRDIIPEVLAAHALSGCDTVACCFGIGKGTVLKVMRSGHSLSNLGHLGVPMAAVIKQATIFMAACYGQKDCVEMSSARLNVWAAKTGKGYTSTPKLCSLPPTNQAFEENVKRAHHQASVWRGLKDANPPTLDPEHYGWKRNMPNKSLVPTTVPENVSLAPASVLRLVKCGCESNTPCSSSRCGCSSANLPCTVFCACRIASCCNINTV